MSAEPERRVLNFSNLDEALVEAERLAAGEVRTTGNHSFSQILKHLALSNDMSSGKVIAPRLPWFMRLMIPLIKPTMLKDKPLTPGFNLPKSAEAFFWPAEEFTVEEALTHFKSSVEHFNKTDPLPKHNVLGKLTREQNVNMNSRHCALHLSFVHPKS